MNAVRYRPILRDALVATLVLGLFYELAESTDVQALQIPGYLLMIGFDVLETFFGSAGTRRPTLIALYLVCLGAFCSGAVSAFRRRMPDSRRAGWQLAVASALGLVGVGSLVLCAAILIGTSQLRPVITTGLSGLVLLAMAAWIAGVVRLDVGA